MQPTSDEKESIDFLRLIPKRSLHAPNWITIILFGFSVITSAVVLQISNTSDDRITESRHRACEAQVAYRVLVARTLNRLEQADAAHTTNPYDSGLTRLHISILHDFRVGYNEIPTFVCP